MNQYTKPHRSVAEQLSLLQERGLSITDQSELEHALRTIGYYRLSAYWYPGQDQLDIAEVGKLLPPRCFKRKSRAEEASPRSARDRAG
jgi:abortive infection bacteriophage resistance protein